MDGYYDMPIIKRTGETMKIQNMSFNKQSQTLKGHKMTKHTPLPYHLDNWTLKDSSGKTVVEINQHFGNFQQLANAQFIVTACNSHYELVEALKGAYRLPSERGPRKRRRPESERPSRVHSDRYHGCY